MHDSFRVLHPRLSGPPKAPISPAHPPLCATYRDSVSLPLQGHRGGITCLAFKRASLQLFSGSNDRTVKVWSLDSLSYIETLYGHQEGVTGVDCLNRERAVSCGGRDRSVRLWKIVEESQLVFDGAVETCSIDCVDMITETAFFSGSQSGTLNIWDTQKKKPVASVKHSHGVGNWITSVAALKFGDVVASGSCDGFVRLWTCGDAQRKLIALAAIPLVGFINGLSFDSAGTKLVAAVGQEHRLGRWQRIKPARNGCVEINILD